MTFARTQSESTPLSRHKRFVALDGFRGVLAVFVAIYHTYWTSMLNSSAFFNHGPVLIDLFFVFSGFLMFTLYSGMRSGGAVVGFFQKRVARLYPVHFVMTLVLLAYSGLRFLIGSGEGAALPFNVGATETWWSLLSNLALVQALGLHDSLSFNVPAWTISVEMVAYVVFAGVCVFAPLRKDWHFWMVGLGVAAIYAGLWRVKPDMNITYDLGLWRCLAGFGVGVLCARTRVWVGERVARLGGAGRTMLELAVMGGFAAFVIWMPGKWQFLVGAFAYVFVVVFAQDAGAVSRVLGARVFRYLAKVSYSLYMVHFVIALAFGILNARVPGLNGDVLLGAYLVCVLLSAHGLWRLVEVPGAALMLRWMRGRKVASVRAAA